MLRKNSFVTLLFICILLLSKGTFLALSLPLSTRSRWLVDAPTGKRVKLHCVNWVAHMETMLVEGLDRKPVGDIASGVVSLGFNCVRLTWATFMFTRDGFLKLRVGESLEANGLAEALINMAKHNPSMINLTLVQAYDEVVDALGVVGLMVVLDNHVSRPQWCCGDDDGNGFFGDTHFDPEEWLQGLASVAQRFGSKSQVVGMSLRNELRGPLQSESNWYRYVELGAAKIHEANPNLLVIVSGLNYGTDLSFLKQKPLAVGEDLGNKLVYEAHWYAFSQGKRHQWEERSPNRVCANSISRFENKVGFVSSTAPLFVSEFGVDQRGVNRADNRFLACFLAYAVSKDLDWALWALQGSYYLRKGRPGFDETYGVLDTGWDHPRNPNFHQRFRLLHQMIKDPESNHSVNHILYHPLSGLCVQTIQDLENNDTAVVQVRDCESEDSRSRWSFRGNGHGDPIWLTGTNLCLRHVGNRLPVILSRECSDWETKWRVLSSSRLQVQIAAMDTQGEFQCLEKSFSNASSLLFTRECLCLDDSFCEENPQSQWFKRISTNVL
ncbi:glycosyl hydrolase 5 family protein-like [Aristolochia californica]|uniref:glycosyl hydrolase 5 family protein-like n=1 Tax=Aristolochia californica TaxID=171875 RepID=UPI0035D8ABF8